MRRGVYGYICVACDHPVSLHLGVGDFDLHAGPRKCELCPCEIGQDAPMIGLNKPQFAEHERRAGR